MDFELTDDQVELQEGFRKLLAGHFSIDRVRELEAVGGVDRALWRELADAGVFGIRLAEAAGGVGLGAAEAVLVFEELGRSVVPGPLVATELAARLIPNAATGAEIVGLVERADHVLVGHMASLDRLLVLDDRGVWSVDPASLDATPSSRPLDPLTPVHAVRVLPEGEQLGDATVADRFRTEGAVLTAAVQLGLAEAVIDLSVDYAKERQQFDRPIGGFQAVKHILADMLVRSEVARAAVYAAGVTIDDPAVGDIRRAASAAKLMAGDAAVKNGKAAIQVHGGMGFTWEVDLHLFLKRAWVLDNDFGTVDEHSERIALLL